MKWGECTLIDILFLGFDASPSNILNNRRSAIHLHRKLTECSEKPVAQLSGFIIYLLVSTTTLTSIFLSIGFKINLSTRIN